MPTCGIYKITNQINGKCYIGQSVHIEKRWQEHKTRSADIKYNQSSALYSAILKYGLENFSFEILEECPKEKLDEAEIYYISKYNSFNPSFGYNRTRGGQSLKFLGKLSEEQVEEIISELKNSQKSQNDIAISYGVSDRAINAINKGISHFQPNEIYPIRPLGWFPEETKNKKDSNGNRIISQPIIKRCDYCGKEFKAEKEKNHFCSQKCACLASQKFQITREELKKRIRTESFSQIGKDFNVSSNAIKHRCQRLNLPYRKKDIDAYSDEEWAKL